MRWAKLLGLAVLAEVALIAAAVLFMLVYSTTIHPGEDAAFYDKQARVLLPSLAIIVGFPVFYLLARRAGGWRLALVFLGIHVAIDVSLSLATDGLAGLVAILPLWLLSQGDKLLGCWLGSGNLKD